jgi:putative transposase
MIISFFSIVMVPCNACTRPSISWRVSTPDVRPVRRLQLSTARARKPLKRGSGLDPLGYDAGKKVTGRKRHILVDTLGLLLSVVIHSNSVQDRDGARDVLRQARRRFPFIQTIFADAGYQGPKMAKTVAATGTWRIVIVKRSDAHRFVVLPKRWIVERMLAWISRNRRLTRDFERYATTVAAFVRLAMIRITLKRLTRPSHRS